MLFITFFTCFIFFGHGDQARIQDFCQGRAPREWWPYMGWEWAIFDIRKHRFATFQDVYCHIMPEWCLKTIQETPVSLLSAPEMREPAPSARVLPSQGWAPAPAPPPLDPRLVTGIASTLRILAWSQVKKFKRSLWKPFWGLVLAQLLFFGFTQSLMSARCSIFEPNRRREAVEGSSNRRSTRLKVAAGRNLHQLVQMNPSSYPHLHANTTQP